MATSNSHSQSRAERLASLRERVRRTRNEIARLQPHVLLPITRRDYILRDHLMTLEHELGRLERLIAHIEAGGDPDDEV